MKTTRFWKAVSAWLAVSLVLSFTIIAPTVFVIAGSDSTVTKSADFDSQTGCEDDTSTKPSGETEAIKMTTGDVGTISLDEWTALDLSFQARVENSADQFVVTIEDADDSANYLEITFTAWTSSAQVKVEVEDHIEGTSESTDNTESVASTGTGMVDNFITVDIDITDTTKSTDGSRQKISVSVGGTDIIEDHPLLSYELSTETKERNFEDISTTVKVSGDIAYFDLFDADSTSGGWSWNTTWILLGIVTVILALVLIFKRQTVGKKLSAAKDKISGS